MSTGPTRQFHEPQESKNRLNRRNVLVLCPGQPKTGDVACVRTGLARRHRRQKFRRRQKISKKAGQKRTAGDFRCGAAQPVERTQVFAGSEITTTEKASKQTCAAPGAARHGVKVARSA